MGIETAFFISLGITFLLLIALVYHFYNKFQFLDNRLSKIIDAMNMLVTETGQELESTKLNVEQRIQQIETHLFHNIAPPSLERSSPEIVEINLGNHLKQPPPSFYSSMFPPEMFAQQSGSLEPMYLNSNTENDENDENEDDDDSDNESSSVSSDEEDSEDGDDNEPVEPYQETNHTHPHEKVIEISPSSFSYSSIHDKIVVSDTEVEEDLEPISLEQMIVHKLDSQEEKQPELNILPIYKNEIDSTLANNDYRKLDVSHLRAMAMQRGMDAKDAKKMKKNELIAVLGSVAVDSEKNENNPQE